MFNDVYKKLLACVEQVGNPNTGLEEAHAKYREGLDAAEKCQTMIRSILREVDENGQK